MQHFTCNRRPATAMLRKVSSFEESVLDNVLYFLNSRLCVISSGDHRELWRRHPCPERLAPDRGCNQQEQKNGAGHSGCGTAGNQDRCLQQGCAVQSGSSDERLPLFSLVMLFCSFFIHPSAVLQMFTSQERSSVWGNPQVALPPYYAAFVNGIAVSTLERCISCGETRSKLQR